MDFDVKQDNTPIYGLYIIATPTGRGIMLSAMVKVYLLLSQQINWLEQSRVRELYPTWGLRRDL